MIHEYFHATQHGYALVQQDTEAGDEQAWIIEGMATAAKESYFLDGQMLRSQIGGWEKPQKVDDALDVGVWEDVPRDEYFAQDFWVYVGQRFGLGLGYLAPILEAGGATTGGVMAALEGWRHLTGLSRAQRYFVVLANADRSAQQLFFIGIEPQ
jgi:hypothetical protein